MRSAALVALDGSIDWYCWPSFDSPAVFCRLLDARIGGFYRIGPLHSFNGKRAYHCNTNVLVTTFTEPSGAWRLTDFMPVYAGDQARGVHRVIRLVEGLAEAPEILVEFGPTPDFARQRADLKIEHGALGTCVATTQMCLYSLTPLPLEVSEDGVLRARAQIAAGERRWFVLDCAAEGVTLKTLQLSEPALERALQKTIAYWEQWSARCTYTGPYHEWVRRSALCVKLLTYAPSGAIIAAPTTSLPEQIGGVRNWDYRYTWLRDAALMLYALQSIGYHEEADAYFEWLKQLCLKCRSEPQIMYSIEGRADLREYTLDHLEGYRCSGPVRVGNAAFSQRQLDIYGGILDAAYLHVHARGQQIDEPMWNVLRRFANEAAERWHQPDQGIWEVRGGPQHFLYSKLMCWVALDRAIRIQSLALFEATELEVWNTTRERIAQTLLNEGYSEELGAFTQTIGGRALDASALAVPRVGFLPASDPRVTSTFERISERLSSHGLIYRYRLEESVDGLPGQEATFALCSFWMVDNLAVAGRIEQARELFTRVTSFANDVGLLAEEIEPRTGELLGNFPQGFTHLALIRAALSIARAETEGAEACAEMLAEREHPPTTQTSG